MNGKYNSVPPKLIASWVGLGCCRWRRHFAKYPNGDWEMVGAA